MKLSKFKQLVAELFPIGFINAKVTGNRKITLNFITTKRYTTEEQILKSCDD